MEASENNNDNNDSNIIKIFLLEISGKFKISSTVEYSNYEEALDSFNQHSKSGKNLILYEIHRSTLDGSVVKKVPVLNTSKHAERMRMLEEEARLKSLSQNQNQANSQSGPQSPYSSSSSPSSTSPSNQKNKMTLAKMKYKIIILVGVVGGFILILFLLDYLAALNTGGSSMGGHHFILFDALHSNIIQISSFNTNELVTIQQQQQQQQQ
jgi:hypothetical protein